METKPYIKLEFRVSRFSRFDFMKGAMGGRGLKQNKMFGFYKSSHLSDTIRM